VDDVDRPGPLLSVVVPVYRVEDYLSRCLDSILAGPDDRIEVVGVDDRSPDRSGELLDGYARRDRRVRPLHLPHNAGLGRARNAGLAHARGRYVWFVDSDDWLTPGAVPAVLDRLARTDPDVLVVGHADVHPDGRWVPHTPGRFGARRVDGPPAPLARRPDLLRLAHSACTKVAHRGLLDRTGLRFTSGWYEDGLFSHVLLLSAPRIDVLDRICYCYRQRPSGAITASVSDRHFEVFGQYDELWTMLDRRGGHERYRPDLFRLMIDHYLVIAGNPHRVPGRLRRDFFARAAADYHRRLPAGGYPVPGGPAGLKHRLLRRHAYLPYALLRAAWRAAEPARRLRPR
jgi:glycosyltransferase involved in cell wall biosynthesis